VGTALVKTFSDEKPERKDEGRIKKDEVRKIAEI
jgi:hypothetical protein